MHNTSDKATPNDIALNIVTLAGKECLLLRFLWENVFSEDTAEFTDYYFEHKILRNHAFAIMTEDRTAYAAMLHLSPYQLMLRTAHKFITAEINYIVGVATLEDYRHRKYMDHLLKKSFQYMWEKKQSFTFLMPASPKIYEPYQFVFIYDREEYKVEYENSAPELKAAEQAECQYEWISLKTEDVSELSSFAEDKLEKEFDVFIRRDEAYYHMMQKELEAQNGTIYLIREKKGKNSRPSISGYCLYTEEKGKPEIMELVTDIKTTNADRGILNLSLKKEKTPVIMARIINVEEMLSLLYTDKNNIMLTILVDDSIIEENNRIWECRIGKNKTAINKAAEGVAADCKTSIEKLTEWIFGRRKAEDCFAFEDISIKRDTLCKLKSLHLLSKVLINEIV